MAEHTQHTWVLRNGCYVCVLCPQIRTVETMERLSR